MYHEIDLERKADKNKRITQIPYIDSHREGRKVGKRYKTETPENFFNKKFSKTLKP